MYLCLFRTHYLFILINAFKFGHIPTAHACQPWVNVYLCSWVQLFRGDARCLVSTWCVSKCSLSIKFQQKFCQHQWFCYIFQNKWSTKQSHYTSACTHTHPHIVHFIYILSFCLKHSLRLPSISAWLLRVRTPCLYVAALSRSGMAIKGLLPSVTLTTRLPPGSHWSSTSSDRLFLNSSSSLQIQIMLHRYRLPQFIFLCSYETIHSVFFNCTDTHMAHSSFSFFIELYST